MTGVDQRRSKFAAAIRQSVPLAAERDRFIKALDALIAWSQLRGGELKLRTDYVQGVVAYGRSSDGVVLWSAYPKDGGAKLEIFPHSLTNQPAAARALIDEMLTDIGTESPVGDDVIMISFLKLKNTAKRNRIIQLLNDLLTPPT